MQNAKLADENPSKNYNCSKISILKRATLGAGVPAQTVRPVQPQPYDPASSRPICPLTSPPILPLRMHRGRCSLSPARPPGPPETTPSLRRSRAAGCCTRRRSTTSSRMFLAGSTHGAKTSPVGCTSPSLVMVAAPATPVAGCSSAGCSSCYRRLQPNVSRFRFLLHYHSKWRQRLQQKKSVTVVAGCSSSLQVAAAASKKERMYQSRCRM